MLERFFDFSAWVGGDILWGAWTFIGLLAAGLLFTVWTRFTQYRSMTHGIAVIRGRYDDSKDPGAINHFQALSAALSATVGLGNIGGVALAVGAGGPGSIFWMWITGVLGMALKTVEITLSQMYRNVDDPDNPHGGAMWVVEKVIARKGGPWKIFGRAFAVFFCITLLISAITGGNMYQAWSVANLSDTYFGFPRVGTGIVLAIVIGLVIIGGIKRIGQVAGRLVPFMCILYLLCALSVLVMHVSEIPGYLWLIVRSAFAPEQAGGAFLGGTAGWAFSQGLRRALFSNEAGQGSAPIAHAAAKTNEPAREGIIGGLGPVIDTLIVCTLTALVIIATGTWKRDPLLPFSTLDTAPVVAPSFEFEDSILLTTDDDLEGAQAFIDLQPPADHPPDAPRPSDRLTGTIAAGAGGGLVVQWDIYTAFAAPRARSLLVKCQAEDGGDERACGEIAAPPQAFPATGDDKPLWGILSAPQPVHIEPDEQYRWDHIDRVFVVVEADESEDTGFNRHRINGSATLNRQDVLTVEWETLASAVKPTFALDRDEGGGEKGLGIYRRYDGAPLTAHAFDCQFPGLGKWMVTIAAWLFAVSTMISWSYYGEQGMIYMLGQKSVLPYKLIYLAAVIFAAGWVTTTGDIENLMDLGTGAMLWSNLPIILVLGFLAVRCVADYDRRLKAGEFTPHKARSITDLAAGRDEVE